MKASSDKLTPKQERAIIALLLHPTISEAAQAVGVSEVMLWRWLQVPAFQAQYRHARRQMGNQAIAQVQHVAGKAVTTLEAVMDSKTASPASRVSAARAVLELALKAVELEELDERLSALEAAVTPQQGRTHGHQRPAS
jgi:hypothetical protein